MKLTDAKCSTRLCLSQPFGTHLSSPACPSNRKVMDVTVATDHRTDQRRLYVARKAPSYMANANSYGDWPGEYIWLCLSTFRRRDYRLTSMTGPHCRQRQPWRKERIPTCSLQTSTRITRGFQVLSIRFACLFVVVDAFQSALVKVIASLIAIRSDESIP